MNRYIVDDYFSKSKSVLLELDIVDKPRMIFNVDEKGIRLCRHKSPKVLAKKGTRRVHNRGKEHSENVTIVGAGNALGTAVPPFVIFKGVRKDPLWKVIYENRSEESWKKKSSGIKRSSVYLTPRREVTFVNVRIKVKKNIIGLVKNGNIAKFQCVTLKEGKFILSNTCAFDTIVQILAVAFCDSDQYSDCVDARKVESDFWQLIYNLVHDGVNVQTFKKRARILQGMQWAESLTGGLKALSLEEPIDEFLQKLFERYPSISATCSCNGPHFNSKFIPVTVIVPENKVEEDEMETRLMTSVRDCVEFLKKHTYGERWRGRPCTKDKTVTMAPHLVFSLLNWVPRRDSLAGMPIQEHLRSISTQLKIDDEVFYLRGAATTPAGQGHETKVDFDIGSRSVFEPHKSEDELEMTINQEEREELDRMINGNAVPKVLNHHRNISPLTGEYVLIPNANPATKTKNKFKGPYQITSVYPNDRYRVEGFDENHSRYNSVHASKHLKRLETFKEHDQSDDE